MKCFTVFAAAIALACSAIDSVSAVGAADVAPVNGKTWSYKTNDASVYPPAEWSQAASACGGKRQSPIDIVPKSNCKANPSSKGVSPLVLSGECTNYKVKQFYDAFKIEADKSTCQVAAKGKPYKFLQAHFHAPAEHTINGKVHDAEIHYVHQATDGLLVIGLFFEKKADAKTDPFVANFFQQIKNVDTNTTVSATFPSFFPTLESTISAGRLFNYPGSLTNPTCAETVDWWVVEKPLAVSTADFDAIQADLKRIQASDGGKAARPVQPLNGRIISSF